MADVDGTFVTEIDGVEYYTDGVKHSGSSFSANIAYIDFSREYDQITDTGAWTVGASTKNPVVNVDNAGNVRVGGKYGVFDAGVVRYADGTTGVYGGVAVGGPLLGFSYSAHGGGASSGPHEMFSTYDHIEVFSDGTYARVEFSPAGNDPNIIGAKFTRTEYNADGTVKNVYVGSTGVKLAQDMASDLADHIYDQNGYWGSDCFVAGTPILLPSGAYTPIERVHEGLEVASFNEHSNSGRGALEAKQVVRIYTSVTQELYRLEFPDGRAPIFVTPGHSVLDETGGFTQIGQLIRLGGSAARLVDQSGEIVTVQADLIRYSAETADMFERSSVQSMTVNGNIAFKEDVEEGWKTYNFEVEDFHTYVSGGIRVHNQSGVLGQIGDTLDNNFFDKLGVVGDAVGDVVSGVFHAAGEIVDGFVRAGQAISNGFQAAGDRFRDGDILGGIGEIGRGIGNAIGEVARGIGEAIGEVARGIGNAISSAFGGRDDNDGQGGDRGKPIILDMDGDGVEISIFGEVSFDMDGDGYLERTDWVSQDDAFLVLDLNADGTRGAGDGQINQTEEPCSLEMDGLGRRN